MRVYRELRARLALSSVYRYNYGPFRGIVPPVKRSSDAPVCPSECVMWNVPIHIEENAARDFADACSSDPSNS